MKLPSALIVVAAGLVLADASIVTLALPDLLHELDTTVEGVAAVIGAYTFVLCVALLPAWRLAGSVGYRRLGTAGFVLFALASVACAQADTLGVLLAGRCVQAVGGAGGLLAAFALLHGGERPQRSLWLSATVLSAAVGPALGGALTQAFDWRAIFEVQVPLALLGALALGVAPEPAVAPGAGRMPRLALGPAAALGCVSAALTGVLFLLILLLVAGWNVSPLEGAAIVTALPAGAVVGSRVRTGDARARALAGCLLVGGGVVALAWLPEAHVAWTVAPQSLGGVGMGLALPALGGEMLPERTPGDAALLLTVRHAGIALALALIAPVAASGLDDTVRDARLQGVSVVLDARLSPTEKIRLAPDLFASVDAREPRDALEEAIAANRSRFSGDERAPYDRLGQRTDDVLVSAVSRAFKPAFLIAAAFALVAALALRPRPGRGVAAVAAAAVAMPVAYAVADRTVGPEPVVIADACEGRALPGTGGIAGRIQDEVLRQLDSIACDQGSSREELVLALASESEAEDYERRYGANPRSLGGALQLLFR